MTPRLVPLDKIAPPLTVYSRLLSGPLGLLGKQIFHLPNSDAHTHTYTHIITPHTYHVRKERIFSFETRVSVELKNQDSSVVPMNHGRALMQQAPQKAERARKKVRPEAFA